MYLWCTCGAQAVGLVKNLALMTHITVGTNKGPIRDLLEEWSMETLEEVAPSTIPQTTKVFLNGEWVGVHHNPASLVATLKSFRRKVPKPMLHCNAQYLTVLQCCIVLHNNVKWGLPISNAKSFWRKVLRHATAWLPW